MAIRRRGNSWQIDYYDPLGKRIRKTFRRRKDAEAELGKRISLLAEGRYLDVKPDTKVTLEELCQKYADIYKNQRSFNRSKRSHLENFKAYFGRSRLISTIGRHDIVSYFAYLQEKPVSLSKTGRIVKRRSPAAVNREMSCLRHLFSEAVSWGMLEKSPFSGGKSLRLKENNARLRFLTDAEIKRLLDACPDHLRPIVACAVLTGMRRGEILGLCWDQIRNGFIYLQKTKTNEARQIPISEPLARLLEELRAKAGSSKHVFTYQGRAIVDNFKHSFRTALEKAGISDLHFHDLRHTFASQVLLHGGTLKDVQELLGHKKIEMTMRYAHLTQESKRAAVNLLGKLSAFSSGDGHIWSQNDRAAEKDHQENR